jgi:hypothetical protein
MEDLLPSPDTKWWIARRNAEEVAAVEGGLLTLDEACERYCLSLQEFAAWQRGGRTRRVGRTPRHQEPILSCRMGAARLPLRPGRQ